MVEFFEDHPFLFLPAITTSIFICFLIFEIAFGWLKKRNLYDRKDSLANFAMYGGYFLINLFWVKIVYSIYTYVHQFAPFNLGANWWAFRDKNLLIVWPTLFVLEDLCFYTFHRTSHALRLFWASHVNHHSSKQFNYTVALRQTWTPFTAFIFWLPLPLIGFDPLLVLTAQLISLFYQSLLHTQLFGSFGFLGWIFNTPSHHRVHHGTNSQYVNRNFGGVLIIWDRLFGTFEKENQKVVYGLTDNIETYNPILIAFHEWSDLLKGIIK